MFSTILAAIVGLRRSMFYLLFVYVCLFVHVYLCLLVGLFMFACLFVFIYITYKTGPQKVVHDSWFFLGVYQPPHSPKNHFWRLTPFENKRYWKTLNTEFSFHFEIYAQIISKKFSIRFSLRSLFAINTTFILTKQINLLQPFKVLVLKSVIARLNKIKLRKCLIRRGGFTIIKWLNT